MGYDSVLKMSVKERHWFLERLNKQLQLEHDAIEKEMKKARKSR
jgi:hypothetical protein